MVCILFYYKLYIFLFKLIRLVCGFGNCMYEDFTVPAHLNPEHKEDISKYF